MPQVAPWHAQLPTALARPGPQLQPARPVQPCPTGKGPKGTQPPGRGGSCAERSASEGSSPGKSTPCQSPIHPPAPATSAVPKIKHLPPKYQENGSEIQLGTGQGDAPSCRSPQAKHPGLLKQPQPPAYAQGVPGLGQNPLPTGSRSGFLRAGIPSREQGTQTSPSLETAKLGRSKGKVWDEAHGPVQCKTSVFWLFCPASGRDTSATATFLTGQSLRGPGAQMGYGLQGR